MGNPTERILRASILLACVCFPAYGLAEVHLGFDQSNYSVSAGGTVKAQVRIDGLGNLEAPSLSAFDLVISYDPSILRPTGAVYGDPILGNQLDLAGLGSLDTAPVIAPPLPVGIASVAFDLPSTLDTKQRGAFTLATISFSGLAGGTSPLAISMVLALADSQGEPLTATLSGATVAVAVPEPSAVVILIVGMLGMMGWAARRRIG
jgi:hypothetical protein